MFKKLIFIFLALFLVLGNNKTLPSNLIVGYANWNECDQKLVEAVQNGVNVLIWFSIDLIDNKTTSKPIVSRGPNMTCVAQIIN